MVDQQAETEIGTSKPVLETAVVGLRKDLRNELKENGALSLDELLTSVYKWEKEHGARLTDEDFEVLEILSLTLGTSKFILRKNVGKEVKYEDTKMAYLESIRTQQEIVKTVLANLDKDGKPNQAIMKSLSLTTEIFEEYFDFENPKLTDLGAATEAGYWQGVQGMATTALLFHESGWEVRLPEAELDLHYDVDLLVITPSGDLYAVDVTAKSPRMTDDAGSLSSPFTVEKGRMQANLIRDKLQNLRGFIKVNVPPMRHHSSYDFYEDRLTGYPSKSSFSEFRQKVDELS